MVFDPVVHDVQEGHFVLLFLLLMVFQPFWNLHVDTFSHKLKTLRIWLFWRVQLCAVAAIIAVCHESLLAKLWDKEVLVGGPSPRVLRSICEHDVCTMDPIFCKFNDAAVDLEWTLEQVLAEVGPVSQVQKLWSHSRTDGLVSELRWRLVPPELSAVLIGPSTRSTISNGSVLNCPPIVVARSNSS